MKNLKHIRSVNQLWDETEDKVGIEIIDDVRREILGSRYGQDVEAIRFSIHEKIWNETS